MFANNLTRKITLLCLILVLACSSASIASFWLISSRYQSSQIEIALLKAEQVVLQYIDTRASLLHSAASVVTADFGFKQAVATRDQATITSVLANHGARINADLMLIVDIDGSPIAGSGEYGNNLNITTKIEDLITPEEVSFLAVNNHSFEIIMLPVLAPRTIAYCVLGFKTDQTVLQRVKELTGMDISLQLTTGEISLSTLAENPKTKTVLDQLQQDGLFQHHTFSIDTEGGPLLSFILSKDLSTERQNLNRMLMSTLALTSLAAILSAIAAIRLGETLTRPLKHLVTRTRKFGRGQYKLEDPPKGATNELLELVGAFNSMGDRIAEREARISYQAKHDFLTGLLNRMAIEDCIRSMLENGEEFSVVAVSIEEFQVIRDQFGSDCADKCLVAMAKRLSENLKAFDFPVAKLDGSHFLIICTSLDNPTTERFTSDILSTLNKAVDLGEVGRALKLHAGVVMVPEHATEIDSIFRRAFMALNIASQENTDVITYRPGDDEQYLKRLAILEDLRQAIDLDDGQLLMAYQPKLRLSDNAAVKAEALIRWQHPSKGFIPPDDFIPLAEQSDLIVKLTHFVLGKVIEQVSLWSAEGIDIQTSINISSQDLLHPEFPSVLRENIHRFNVEPRLINLELTERDLMRNEHKAMAVLSLLRADGYTVAVDDYGIGQSSLAKLKSLPVDEIKIDKSFVLNLDSSTIDQSIVESTIKLGHNLGKKVIAEGVESEAALNLLASFSCDYAQGYYLSRPVDAQMLYDWCLQYRERNKQHGATVTA